MTNLTTNEKTDLNNFISKCVFSNAYFPSEKLGVNKITVQELLHDFSINSLINFGDFIERKLTSNGSSFKQKAGELKFGEIAATELVSALHKIIKYKEFVEERTKNAEILKNLTAELEMFKTPSERKSEIEAKIAALQPMETTE